MVEFKDDGTATTPGKPRENRDAESAVVADLVAVELDDAGLNLNAKRLPFLARIYGAVVLLDGLATLPIMVISILYTVREILDDALAAATDFAGQPVGIRRASGNATRRAGYLACG